MPKTTTPCRICIMFTTGNISKNDYPVPHFGAKVAKTPSPEISGIQKGGITGRFCRGRARKFLTRIARCAAMCRSQKRVSATQVGLASRFCLTRPSTEVLPVPLGHFDPNNQSVPAPWSCAHFLRVAHLREHSEQECSLFLNRYQYQPGSLRSSSSSSFFIPSSGSPRKR